MYYYIFILKSIHNNNKREIYLYLFILIFLKMINFKKLKNNN